MYARQRTNWAGIVLGFLVVLLLAGVSTIAVWEYFQIKQLKNNIETATLSASNAKTNAYELHMQLESLRSQLVAAQAETPAQTQERVIKDLATLRELPKNELPTVAQIIDKSKIVNEPFLANAENGDYIIVYQKSNVSVLYRPADKRIINAGTVTAN